MAGKTTYLHIRTTPQLKAALKKAAEADHRSVASYVEKLLTEAVERQDDNGKKPKRS